MSIMADSEQETLTTPELEHIEKELIPDLEQQIRDAGEIALAHSLSEKLSQLNEFSGRERQQLRSAFEGLRLHPEIQKAAGDAYREGNYILAIQNGANALNDLLRA